MRHNRHHKNYVTNGAGVDIECKQYIETSQHDMFCINKGLETVRGVPVTSA